MKTVEEEINYYTKELNNARSEKSKLEGAREQILKRLSDRSISIQSKEEAIKFREDLEDKLTSLADSIKTQLSILQEMDKFE